MSLRHSTYAIGVEAEVGRQRGDKRGRGGKKRRWPPTSMEFWTGAFEEPAVPFDPESPDLETFRSVYRAVLRAYDWTCALTGLAYEPTEGLHTVLQVTAIRPLAAGGALHVDNFIALSPEADRAFTLGHLAIGPEYRVLADLATIAPKLREQLNPSGQLQLPSGSPPDAAALHWHLVAVFASQPPGGTGD